MSPKLRRLSGLEVISIFDQLGFYLHSRRGNHAKLRRIAPGGEKETLTIPVHAELDVGTLRAVLRQASKYLPLDELRKRFYSE